MNDKLRHQIYMDLFQPSAQRIGMSLFNITDKLSERFENWCNKLDREILSENLISPEPHLLVPILEGMVYHADDTPIQEMFYNLLKNATDKTTQELCHPSFPLILKQLSSKEIEVLYLSERYDTAIMDHAFSSEQYYYHDKNIKGIQVDVIDSHLKTLGLLLENHNYNLNFQEKYNIKNNIVHLSPLSPYGQQFLKACMSERAEELINDIINKNKED